MAVVVATMGVASIAGQQELTEDGASAGLRFAAAHQLAGGYDKPVPGGLQVVSRSSSSLSLDWDGVSGAQMYRVQIAPRATMSGASYHRFTSSHGVVNGLSAGRTYWFRVAVIDPETGAKLSDYTQQPYPSAGLPGAGYDYAVSSHIEATGAGAVTLSLDWAAVEDAPMYRVQYSTRADMRGAAYAGFSDDEGTLTGLRPNTRYYVRVAVVAKAPDSGGSKLGDYTQPTNGSYPAASTRGLYAGGYAYDIAKNLRATDESATSLALDWDTVPGASLYRVQIATNASMSGASYVRFTDSDGEINGLEPGTEYWFRVAVVDPDTGAKFSDYTQEPYPHTSTGLARAIDLTVGSFNIGGVDTDRTVGGDHRPWRDRRAKVISQIVGGGLQIVGLQEANQSSIYNDQGGVDWTPGGDNQFLDLQAGLRATGHDYRLVNDQYYNCERHVSSHNCVYQYRGASNGTRIVYDDSALDVVDSGSVMYTAQSPATTERYFVWARMRVSASGHEFFFATTHLDPYNAGVRGRQWAELIADVEQHNAGDLPVVVVGDFNTSKFNPPTDTMLPAMKNAGFGDVLGQSYRSSSSANVRALVTKQTEFNSFNGYVRDLDGGQKCYCDSPSKLGNGIDYVFATNSLTIKEYDLVADINQDNDLVGVIPSDHHLIRSVVVLPAKND